MAAPQHNAPACGRLRRAASPFPRAASLSIAMACLLCAGARAATILTFGPGSAVTSADRTATFDSIHIGTPLLNYTEDSLIISVNDNAYEGFDAFNGGIAYDFHYGIGGNNDFVTIKTSDGARIHALEFLYGNGAFTDTDVHLLWETWADGGLVSGGSVNEALRGAVYGFSDSSGFDELRIAAGRNLTSLGDYQVIALDNLRVQLSPVAVAETGSSLGLLALALAGIGICRKQR